MTARPTLVLDSPSLVYRAFFALPASIRSPEGGSVNAVRGYLDMVSYLVSNRRPAGTVHTFDADWRPQWRVDEYAGYKATRADDPPELAGQFERILEFLDAAGLPVLAAPGFEADDVIGTLAARASDATPIEVVTGDRDMLQVIRDGVVTVLFTRRGVSELDRFDDAAVRAKYGVPAARYADFAILRGDPSDGLPGVRGVGAKRAAELVTDHATLDDLLADADRRATRLSGSLLQSRDYIAAMQRIVPVRTDLRLELPQPRSADAERLLALADRHGIRSAGERLVEALGLRPGTEPVDVA
ncbi:MAG: 5'-3' exonuclease H3TH domain-containing protein [Candidatus Dormibacteria bacterium]